jgi:D-Tyr-tRNAtyr deacylase
VAIDGVVVGAIDRGFCLLVGFTHADPRAQVEWMAEMAVEIHNDGPVTRMLERGP